MWEAAASAHPDPGKARGFARVHRRKNFGPQHSCRVEVEVIDQRVKATLDGAGTCSCECAGTLNSVGSGYRDQREEPSGHASARARAGPANHPAFAARQYLHVVMDAI